MSFKLHMMAAVAAMALAAPALADGIVVEAPYARTSSAMSTSGAAFMVIRNESGQADHLNGVKTDVAEHAEFHTHVEDANGVVKMLPVPDGFDLPEGGVIEMKRGGNHVMLMGLKQPLEQGDVVPLTLIFEKAGDVVVDVPVDLERKPGQSGAAMDHSGMKMGEDASD
jgi:copper(I)-binding protein